MSLGKDVDSSKNATLMIALLLALVTGVTIYDTMTDPDLKDDICEMEVGDDAVHVDDADDTFDCRTPSGVEVSNVSVTVAGNHGENTLGGQDPELED